MRPFKMAVCQNNPGYDKFKNILDSIEMIKKSTSHGADLVMLPEIFFYPYELQSLRSIVDRNDETLNIMKDLCVKHNIYLQMGSIAEEKDGAFYNSAYLINPSGNVVLKHSKCHLFDVDLPALKTMESSVFKPGNKLEIVSTDLGKIGMLVCYDIRFPEAARKLTLQGMEILLVPAAFNTITGPAHWHINFRMRAVENQVFIAAASPSRNNKLKYQAFGHSLIVDPWGKVLKEAGTREQIIYADIDPNILTQTRERLPLLIHRRGDIY